MKTLLKIIGYSVLGLFLLGIVLTYLLPELTEEEKQALEKSKPAVQAVQETEKEQQLEVKPVDPEDVKKIADKVKALLDQGSSMAILREVRGHPINTPKCMKLFKQLGSQASTIRQQAEDLPNFQYIPLKDAAFRIGLCVSCNKSLAEDYCKMGKESLQRHYKDLNSE